MKQGHVFLKKLPKQILQYAILLLGAFCALVPIVSCVTTAFKNDEEYRTTSVMTLPESWLNFENFKVAWEKADMGKAFLNSFLILVRAGVARTFLQIPGVTGIKIFIESEELKDSKGQAVGVIDGNTFVEMWGSDKDAYRYDTFTLYFTDKTGEHLVAEQRNVYYKRILPRERVILEQLAKGPMVKGHYPTIPQETEILGVEVSDDVCYVDFSSAFSDSGIDIPVNTMIYSVVNSLLDTASADKVQISVEGDTEATLSDGTSLYSLFSKNTDLVLKEDQSE